MRLHRFYLSQEIREEKEIRTSDQELISQLLNVFRFKIGQKVILFDGSGSEYEGEITEISKREASFGILSKSTKPVSDKKVSLYLALIKKSNFELAAEKATEVGVAEIHPLISERSEKKGLNIERLEKIVKEASEQSGRVTLPKIYNINDLEIAINQAAKEGKRGVVFQTNIDTPFKITQTNSLHLMQTNHSEGCLNNFEGGVAAFVGPEGGWTEAEVNLFKKNNFEFRSLGQNILRAETAAIVAVWSFLNSIDNT